MHIVDGNLSLASCALRYGSTVAFVIPGIREIKMRAQKNFAYRLFLAINGTDRNGASQTGFTSWTG